MGEEIKAGEALLNSMNSMIEIEVKLVNAMEKIDNALRLISDDAIYQGMAHEEMESFYSSLIMHIGKMLTFYQAGSALLYQTYQQFYYNEEQIITWYTKLIAEEN